MSSRNHACKLHCFIFLLSVLVSHYAQAKDTIKWLVYDWPPVYITDGPFQGQGNADAILKFFQQQLIGYDHVTVPVNPARAIATMRSGADACMVGTLKTPEREKFLYFAIPIGITLPNAIIMTNKRWLELGSWREVALEDLLNRKDLIGGIVNERSYTPQLDQILQNVDQNRMVVVSRRSMAENLLSMLKVGRIDYFIEYPWVAVFMEKMLFDKTDVTSIPIKEIEPFSFGRMACSKTVWGKKIIGRINKILLKHRPTEKYREFVERWNDEQSLIRIRKAYDEIFIHKMD